MDEESLPKQVKGLEKRPRGHPHFKWIDGLRDFCGQKLAPKEPADNEPKNVMDISQRLEVPAPAEEKHLSRRKRFWNSFCRHTQRFRSGGKEKTKHQDLLEATRLSASQPDISKDSPTFTCAKQTAATYVVSSCGSPQLMTKTRHLSTDGASFSDPNLVSRGSKMSNKSVDTSEASAHEEVERIVPELHVECRTDRESDSGIIIGEHLEVTSLRQQSSLRQHAFFQMEVTLKEGRDLVIRDKSGSSDPYVKFKIDGRLLYKSKIVFKNLNPVWDEKFILPIEDVFKPIHVKVFDYDRGLQDDFMGAAYIDLTTLELDRTSDLKLMLTETGKSDYMGYLLLEVRLTPKTQEEKDTLAVVDLSDGSDDIPIVVSKTKEFSFKKQFYRKSMRLAEANKKLKCQIWSSVVTIVLVEGKNLLAMDDSGLSDPYVKFRLSNEKYKSKCARQTLNPEWLEQFDLHMFDGQSKVLDITVWDRDVGSRDDFMGRCSLDLSDLHREETHNVWMDLEDGAGSLHLLLTISGTTGSETISDLANYEPNPNERLAVLNKYCLSRSFQNLRDIGHLTVKVYKAQGLASADIGGKSDPFCVLELVNARLQTQTEYKTLSPEWNKIFTFNIKDVHSVLELTVYDEDRDKKVEFLGKIAIPILKIKNGEKKWYALKDKKCRGRAKGQILLEMDAIYNPIKASIRTVNPREEKYMQQEQKFKVQVFLRNVMRVRAILLAILDMGKFLQSCTQWESPVRSITAFVVFLIVTYSFELYMLPIFLLLIFIENYIVSSMSGGLIKREEEEDYFHDDEDDDDDDKEKEEKKTLKEKLQAVQEVCQTVQNALDAIASFCERIKNTFNFTVPFLSCLAICLLFVGTIVLYFIPLRFLIMLWGINKFTRKLRAPNSIPNNEILDFLSRVPSDVEVAMYREFRPDRVNEMSGDSFKSKKKRH